MPVAKLDQVLVACPHCGHQQQEWRGAFSTNCRKCHQHYRVQDALNPVRKAPDRAPPQRRLTCFDCGTALDVPATAESTMCKRCGRYVDLHDYSITTAVAKNFRTRGRLVVEPKGYLFNTETTVEHAVIKGRFHGKLTVEKSLTVFAGSEIKGSLTAGHLIIPAESHFRWPSSLKLTSAEIAGELAANVHASGTITLKPTARWFGDISAQNVVVEEGAIVVGTLRIGAKADNLL